MSNNEKEINMHKLHVFQRSEKITYNTFNQAKQRNRLRINYMIYKKFQRNTSYNRYNMIEQNFREIINNITKSKTA